MRDLFVSWRVIAATACVSAIAGLGAAWLGAAVFLDGTKDDFPQMLAQLIDSDSVNLQPEQRRQIDALTVEYRARRSRSGLRLRAALIELSESIVKENQLASRSLAAAGTVNEVAQQRRLESIVYITEVRKLLDEAQRREFDRNFLRAIATDTSGQGR